MREKYATYNKATWYRYSHVKPPCDGIYIVTCRDAIRATVLNYEDGKWTDDRGNKYSVVAWTFLPGIYRSDEE